MEREKNVLGTRIELSVLTIDFAYPMVHIVISNYLYFCHLYLRLFFFYIPLSV